MRSTSWSTTPGATWGAPLEEFDEAAFERVLSLNVKGVFHVTKFLVPLLRAAGTVEEPARVINIGSIDGIGVPALETYSYSASKAAVHHLTRHLAKRLAPEITVNAIAPGPFESKMMAATLEAFGEQIAKSAPLRRIGRPDDMAGAAIYLSSRAGRVPDRRRHPGRRWYRHDPLTKGTPRGTMFLLHEVHTVAGKEEEAFDAAYRDELLPTLGKTTEDAGSSCTSGSPMGAGGPTPSSPSSGVATQRPGPLWPIASARATWRRGRPRSTPCATSTRPRS